MKKLVGLGICRGKEPSAQNKNAASGLKSQAAFFFQSQALYISKLLG
jgi:hypothetical protein